MVIPYKLELPAGQQGKRQRARRPYRQGSLDGLCGLYSTVHALRAVCPEMTDKVCSSLFRHLTRSLRNRTHEPLNMITGGIALPTLRYLLKCAIAFVGRKLNIVVTARQLSKPVRATKQINRLWRELTAVLSPTAVAIISVQGRISHWTVVTGLSAKHLLLLDSGELKRFRLSNCSVTLSDDLYSISPTEVTIVERIDRVG